MNEMIQLPEFAAAWDEQHPYDDRPMSNNGSFGILEYYGVGRESNEACFIYMMEQFQRFGIRPIPQDDLLSYCWTTALYYIDTYDPYLMFDGLTDVIKTKEAYYYQYSYFNEDEDRWYDVKGDYIETFRYWADGSKNWHYVNTQPGLKKHFPALYDYFEEHFVFLNADQFDAEFYAEERALIKKYGPTTTDLIHLGIWAAVMWMCAPMAESVEWREHYHPIYNFCYQDGACLVLEGMHFVGPSHYKRHERPVNSCAKCGIQDWCVEIVDMKTSVELLCEHCVSGGERFPSRVCGRRMCETTSCQNHPFFKDDEAKTKLRMLAAAKRFGPLRTLENGMKVRSLPGFIVAEMKQIQQIGKGVGDRAGGEAYQIVANILKQIH